MRATINDVALLAGVSKSTASYALSGKRSISAEVRRKVEEAVALLEYEPNAGARALASSRTQVLGLLARYLDDEFAPAMQQFTLGVTDTARELGYDTLLVTQADGVGALTRLSRSRTVDGFVLLNVAEFDERLVAVRATGTPSALIGLPHDPSGVDAFDLDFPATGRVMVDRMADAGHRDIVLVSQPAHVEERGGAYVRRLREAAEDRAVERGVRLHHRNAASSQPAVGADLHTMLDDLPGATGLLLNNEAAAAALPSILVARGVRVPDDLSVLGRHSEDFARTFSLPYSAVDSAPVELSRRAVRQVVARIDATGLPMALPAVSDLIPPVIVERGSVGAPPRGAAAAPN